MMKRRLADTALSIAVNMPQSLRDEIAHHNWRQEQMAACAALGLDPADWQRHEQTIYTAATRTLAPNTAYVRAGMEELRRLLSEGAPLPEATPEAWAAHFKRRYLEELARELM